MNEPPYPTERRDLINLLDGDRHMAARLLGAEHPLTAFADAALRRGDLRLMRAARAACVAFDLATD